MALGSNVLNWGQAWEWEGVVSATLSGGEGALHERLFSCNPQNSSSRLQLLFAFDK